MISASAGTLGVESQFLESQFQLERAVTSRLRHEAGGEGTSDEGV